MKMACRGNGPVHQGAISIWAWQKVDDQPTQRLMFLSQRPGPGHQSVE